MQCETCGQAHGPAKRMRSHLESNDLLNRYQSAYRPMYSTEGAE